MNLPHEHSTSSLALSDIMHAMSPSPTPPGPLNSQNFETPSHVTSIERSESPEPIHFEELASFRTRIEELGIMSGDTNALTPRERELSAMILRLIEAPRPDPSQLVQQATLIADLKVQRDFLTQCIADERARIESERSGWERAVEALISQHQRSGKNVYYSRQDELERQCVALQQDNRELRDREQETHARLSCLEGELYRLKPLLVMNPQVAYTTLNSTSAYMSGLPYPSATGAVALKESKDKLIKKRKREKEAKESKLSVSRNLDEPSQNGPSRGSGTRDTPENQQAGPSSSALVSKPGIPLPGSSLVQDTQRSSAPSIYQHLLRKPQNLAQTEPSISVASNQKLKQRSKSPKRYTSITSDARSEHYLLAARKIGRERAAIVTGLVNSKTERDQERHRQAKEEMERERQAAGFTGYYRNVSAAPTAAKKGKGKTPANSNPPPKPPTATTSHPSIIPLQYPTTPNSAAKNNTSPRTPTPKRPGTIPGVQLFQHPGSPHGATYMFVPNPGLVGYSHPHLQTPPGALRMPIITSPLAAAAPSVASTSTKPAGQPSGTTGQVPRQVGGQSADSQTRKNQSADDVDVTASTVADAINQSLDSSSPTVASSSSSSTVPQPKTPLASLLSAAQSMMEDGSGEKKPGKRKSSSQPESPTSKRRKTNSANASVVNVRSLEKRVRSALDVLADQAAAAGAGSASASASQQTDQAESWSSSTTATATKNNGFGVRTRRSSRSKKGKRKEEALVDAPLPRIISPAGSIGRRGSTPRMIILPDSRRSSEATPQSQSAGGSTPLLPPPLITTSNSSVASTSSVDKTSVAAAAVLPSQHVDKGESSDPGCVQDRATVPHIEDGNSDKEVDSKATMTTTEASSLAPGPIIQPSAPDSEPIDDIPTNSASSPSLTAPETQNQPPPDQERPAVVVRSLKDKEKRSIPAEGELDSDADGDADPDVDVEMGSSVE